MASASQAAGFAAVAATGLFSGGALYVQLVQTPSANDLGRTRRLGSEARALPTQFFKAMIGRASAFHGGLAFFACAAALAAARWTSNKKECRTFLLAAALIGAVLPFTSAVLLPIAQAIESHADDNEAAPADLFRRWARLHRLRTALGCASLGVLLYTQQHKGHKP